MQSESASPILPLICHVNLARGYRGGERQTELLIRQLAARAFRQRLIGRAGEPLIAGLRDLPGLQRVEVGGRTGALIASRGCALLHAHEAKAAHVGRFANALWNIPFVVTRRVDNPLSGPRFAAWVHRGASRVVALSRGIRTVLHQLDPQLAVDIIPSAASPLEVREDTVARLRQQFSGSFLIGHVGALVDRHKGQSVLIEAARLLGDLSELKFLLVGSGEDDSRLRKAAAGLPVYFAGQVDDVGSYLAAMQLFAFPSNKEGLGSVLIDAMASGLPIVATRAGGIPDLVEDGRNGLLVPPGDPKSLAAAIRRLYSDSTLCNAMGQLNRQTAQRYSAAVMADRYEQIYRQVLAEVPK